MKTEFAAIFFVEEMLIQIAFAIYSQYIHLKKKRYISKFLNYQVEESLYSPFGGTFEGFLKYPTRRPPPPYPERVEQYRFNFYTTPRKLVIGNKIPPLLPEKVFRFKIHPSFQCITTWRGRVH
jgi:hypothetical protein